MNAIRHAVALASLCLLSACGGGGDAPSEPTSSQARPATAIRSDFVQLEGCVTDRQDRPIATGVQALGSDGRLVASTRSQADGLFTLRVPARSSVQLSLDAPGQDRLELLTGSTSLTLTGCLHLA
ncbi:hypothetical protein LRS03_01450 [Rhizobacter sp. J219]|uniref:hypothetical protein n=1 Tax=Rhizobacter sp. J219 TaxID=2898430 RepID=UPI002150EC7E|nr:hypothetical protein [Rhizobacter sp. J219]MCR5881600.1 hypothetical protein [Rhizobacter sp. J219]